MTTTFPVNMTGIQTTLDVTTSEQLLFGTSPSPLGTYFINVSDNTNGCIFACQILIDSNEAYLCSVSYGQNTMNTLLPASIYAYQYNQHLNLNFIDNALYVNCDSGTIPNVTFRTTIL